ncbi:hypothetical protein BRADI_5g21654v3 [Brachypodium distachyon]|uniref:Uncharacterized protein n=1 Tax=Brachypodium distachyon TaxID=15368 RepID=A0A0Q3P6I1_BRADI|nr:hypothetical protein BRADI_5g21654v3 [Brachypodium distachyon]
MLSPYESSWCCVVSHLPIHSFMTRPTTTSLSQWKLICAHALLCIHASDGPLVTTLNWHASMQAKNRKTYCVELLCKLSLVHQYSSVYYIAW